MDSTTNYINFYNCMISISQRCFLPNNPQIIFMSHNIISISHEVWYKDIFKLDISDPAVILSFLMDSTSDNKKL